MTTSIATSLSASSSFMMATAAVTTTTTVPCPAAAARNVPRIGIESLELGEIIGKGSFCTVEVLNGLRSPSSTPRQQGEQQEAKQRNHSLHNQDIINNDVDQGEEKGQQQESSSILAMMSVHPHRYVVKRPRVAVNYKKAVRDLRRETRLLSGLVHPNIIAIRCAAIVDDDHDDHEDEDAAIIDESSGGGVRAGSFIVLDRCGITLLSRMEEWRQGRGWRRGHGVVRGGLRRMVGRGRSSRRVHDDARKDVYKMQFTACAELTEAVDYLHELNILYRDLKPENIGFAHDDGRLQLFDFGLATKLDCAIESSYDQGCYKQSTLAGSYPYVAPEIVLGCPYGLSADTFSLALVLWEILSLKEPFENLIHRTFVQKVVKGGQRPKINPHWSPAVQTLLAICWQPDPNQRPPMFIVNKQMRELINGLEEL